MANAWREYMDKVRNFPYDEVLQQRREAGETDLTLGDLIREVDQREKEEMLRKKGMTWEEYRESDEYREVLEESARYRFTSPEPFLDVEWETWEEYKKTERYQETLKNRERYRFTSPEFYEMLQKEWLELQEKQAGQSSNETEPGKDEA